MNIADSERIVEKMEGMNLKRADNKSVADFLIINMCSIRQSAVDRVYGQLANLKNKKYKPKIIITGCILDRDYRNFQEKADFIIKINDDDSWEKIIPNQAKNPCEKNMKKRGFSALIPIITGCDNFCSYCVVPYTRGREKSISFDEIIQKTKNFIKSGYKEIWLLGQNVNSYNNNGKNFSDLLREINKIDGNFWIRYTSSHPKDFTDDLIRTIGTSDKITKYVNLPIQSGDDEILKKMNRPYTVSEYRECVYKIREVLPDISLSTDVIVGFPGETKKHFNNTLKIFKELKFDMAYISRYSPRPQTRAFLQEDEVPSEEKAKRWNVLSKIVGKESLKRNKLLVGKTIDVFPFKFRSEYLLGKSNGNKTVRFKKENNMIGDFVKVKINKALPWSLEGKIQ